MPSLNTILKESDDLFDEKFPHDTACESSWSVLAPCNCGIDDMKKFQRSRSIALLEALRGEVREKRGKDHLDNVVFSRGYESALTHIETLIEKAIQEI